MPVFPIPGYTGKVDLHWGTNSGGSDLFAANGTPVVSMVGGQVISASNDPIGGNNILIRGVDGLLYYFAHLSSMAVSTGSKVGEGQLIGRVGDTGNAVNAGPHLHIGIGKDIISGTGAAGGTGSGFDAVSYLRSLLPGAKAQPNPAPPSVDPVVVGGVDVSGAVGSAVGAVGSTVGSVVNPLIKPVQDFGKGVSDVTTGLAGVASGISQATQEFQDRVTGLYSTLEWFGQVNIWKRAGLMLLGFVLFAIGLILFALSFVDSSKVPKVVPVPA